MLVLFTVLSSSAIGTGLQPPLVTSTKNKPEDEIIRIENGMPRIVDDDTFLRLILEIRDLTDYLPNAIQESKVFLRAILPTKCLENQLLSSFPCLPDFQDRFQLCEAWRNA